MASNPPFMVEDQTDEDFFDKLVNDDDDVAPSAAVVGPGFGDGNESDEAKAFENLSIGEVNGNEKNAKNEVEAFANSTTGEVNSNVYNTDDYTGSDGLGGSRKGFETYGGVGGVTEGELKEAGTVLGNVEESIGPVVAENSIPHVDLVDRSNNSSEASSDCTMISKSSGSGGSGIKEVDWTAFNANSPQDGKNGFGSYSDFFSGLEGNDVGPVGIVGENLNIESKVLSGNELYESGYMGDSNSYSQYQDNYAYTAASGSIVAGQDVNSIQYWESQYPGWKYDTATGQWYQMDGWDASTNVQGNIEPNSAADWSLSDGKSAVSYLQQTAQSLTQTIPESGRTESVTNCNHVSGVSETTGAISNWNQVPQGTEDGGFASDWNQVSQVNNGYPSHMVFYPQYPGWYYDSIAQEWRSLDSYTTSAQSAVQTQDQLTQNGLSPSQIHKDNPQIYDTNGKVNNDTTSHGFSSQGKYYNRAGSFNSIDQQASSVWQPGNVAKNESLSEYSGSLQQGNHSVQNFSESNHFSQRKASDYEGAVSYYGESNKGQGDFSAMPRSRSSVSSGNLYEQFNQSSTEQIEQKHVLNEYYGNQNSVSFSQQPFQAAQQYSYATTPGRSSAGRPPHALATFGFGGKLIVMKNTASNGNLSFGSQNSEGCTVSVLNLAEVVAEKAVASNPQSGVCDYLHALCQQSFPGPLTGGSVSSKELNKWIDERIASLESSDINFRKGEVLRLLLSLLKIACKYYGKLRSPFGSETVAKESDLPESAIADLFASAKRSTAQYNQYGALAQCLQSLPSEGQMRVTAAEVQGLLVSGKKKEALLCAQQGQLWGPALVLAAQLGDQFYVDTVKEMALRQLVAGSPLRTLCLLIAGQPADVFSADAIAGGSMPGVMSIPQQPSQLGVNGMLDDWEENLAVIAANRTKDDELVLIHLGDCLWKEKSDNIAAHICYLVAEANFEPYSDTARLCLVGADHWKFPRTYASPEAIQRTEIFEYSKVLGNSQFILLPFQPYKLVYAHMLAEVGRMSDALKYCQAVLKSLKTGRSPEVEILRQLVTSLEERIKTHQQGGFSTNLASTKLVGKLLNLFDSTAQRVVGGIPPPVPSTSGGSVQTNEHLHQSLGRVSTSQSTMAMSSLMPSTSMEPISEWTADGNKKSMHNRSVSEPDFGRTPRQDQVDSSKDPNSASGGKATSRLGRFGFGSQLLQKTVGLVLRPRQEKQAKLGEKNKFYYDEKLKRWVEEGAEAPAEELAPPPPPTTTAFQNGTSDYNLKNALRSEGSFSNGSPEYKGPATMEHSSGMPPLPPTSNQFSARGRMGVRSRYVDTFNQGGGNQTNTFQPPSVPSVKPATSPNPKFFVPAPVSMEQPVDSAPDNVVGSPVTDGSPSGSSINNPTYLPASSSSGTMPRFASMGSISSKDAAVGNGSLSSHSRRTASWSGSFNDSFSPAERTEVKPLGEILGVPPSFIPSNPLLHSSVNGGSFGEDLHEVEL